MPRYARGLDVLCASLYVWNIFMTVLLQTVLFISLCSFSLPSPHPSSTNICEVISSTFSAHHEGWGMTCLPCWLYIETVVWLKPVLSGHGEEWVSGGLLSIKLQFFGLIKRVQLLFYLILECRVSDWGVASAIQRRVHSRWRGYEGGWKRESCRRLVVNGEWHLSGGPKTEGPITIHKWRYRAL